MKVLLVSSNLHSQFPACFPNAVGALSAYLGREGHEVRALHLARKRDYRKVGPTLREFQPDVVGISVVTCETRIIGPVATEARRWSATVPILAGGIHAIVAPESVFEVPEIDGLCYGEGETAFAEYLERLRTGNDPLATPNFYFRVGGEIRKNPPVPFIEDLDSLPLMDRSVTNLQEVIDANNGTINLIFSRGCPWNCQFCCNHHIKRMQPGTYARVVSVPRVMDELRQLAADYRFRHVLFRDDTFTWNREWAMELVEAYGKEFDYPFDIFSRVDCLDDGMIDALAQAGCRHIFLGLDSGNDYIRNKVLNKEQLNEDLFRVTDRMREKGIVPMVSNIVGLPFETPEMFQDTVEINKRLHKDRVVFSPSCGACPKIWVFTPWPGSDLYKLCKREGWLKEEPTSARVYRDSILEMPGFPRKEIDRQFRSFRYHVYKDHHPFHALLFLVYDSRPVQAVFEKIPMGAMGAVRETFLAALNPQRRKEVLGRLFGLLPRRGYSPPA